MNFSRANKVFFVHVIFLHLVINFELALTKWQNRVGGFMSVFIFQYGLRCLMECPIWMLIIPGFMSYGKS